MVLGWRRAFCASVSRETDSIAMDELEHAHNPSSTTPKIGTRFAFFTSSSNPSSLRCRTTAPSRESDSSPRPSNPSSPFSFLKSSLRLCTRSRCGLCLQSLKKGQGMATFTAECSHTFHFPCISDHVKKQGSLACPLCSCLWKEMPTLCVEDQQQLVDEEMIREKLATRFMDDVIGRQQLKLKVYNDDEPLASLTPKARFIPIPESDENCDEEFHVNAANTSTSVNDHDTDVEVRLLPEAAMIAASRRHETYAVVLKLKAPENVRRRAPIDLVTVVDVSNKITSEKLQMIKGAMRTIVSSLSSSDRLSIVAFASYSKRLLPLRRMTTSGRRAARRIVEAVAVIEGSTSSNSNDAVKKAIKVLEDRREKNPIATVILLSDVINQSSSVSTTRYPIHSLKLGLTEDVGNLFTVVVQDLRLQLGASPAAITAVYSRTPQPIVLGSNTVEIGDLSAGEERELLVELKLPASAVRSHQVLSVRCCYRESSSQEIIYGQQQSLLVPRLTTVRSSSPSIQRLRNLFISVRALAESHRLKERNDLTGAYHMLVSARAVIQQSRPAPDNEFILGLEADLTELQRRRKTQTLAQLGRRGRVEQAPADEKGEPLTPTSTWRVADKLAKVAMMRKSVNRVSDLHGFEDARF